MAEAFDVMVIGAGPGGYVAAIRAAQLGLKTAIVEKRSTLGGTCLNIGCIPSKALLDSSELYVQTKHSLSKHGIAVSGVQLDLAALMARKDGVVKGLTSGIAGLMKKNRITVFTGAGRLTGKRDKEMHEVVIKGDKETALQARHISLATGSEPTRIPSLPFDGKRIVSSTEALAFDAVPKHLIVVGGGYIGLELGSVWHRLGSQVTVIEALPRLVPFADVEMSELLHRALNPQGMAFHFETKVTAAEVQGELVNVKADSKGKEATLQADRVLVAVGRRPYTAGLGLEEAGVEVEGKSGRVVIHDGWQTSVSGIFAIGDIVEGPMLAHKAEDEGVAVA